MELRELIGRIGAKYDRSLPMSSEAQLLLRSAGAEFDQWLPVGYRAEGSGGKGNPASCPWIAVFDPDETDNARHGMYVVYLFAEDLSTVALTLNQGVTELRQDHGGRRARALLNRQAQAIRAAFEPTETADLDVAIDLRTAATLPVDYEHGTVLALTYVLSALPSERVMVADLQRFVRLYATALRAREDARRAGDEAIVTPSPAKSTKKWAAEFKPKSDTEYRQTIAAREIVKTRRHETLIRLYGIFLESRGFRVATNVHPRDLTADRDGRHWLIEAKTVDAGNGVDATRAALAQLLFYSHFHYGDHGASVHRLALFTEPVGPACVNFLEALGVAAVWKEHGAWVGSPSAVQGELC